MILCYSSLLKEALRNTEISIAEKQAQLAYHTVYFYQVLTLDRGTTSGLLVHNENDVGILASLPTHIDRELLTSWIEKTPFPQSKLVSRLLNVLPSEKKCPVSDSTKRELAEQVREHYKEHPEALKLQASGNIIPPTVQNHK
ncbi:MAG: hypothetical protein JKY42_01160 [Flavobacteriales bacterium]|nr:hypothetical protein [Flavobacteriales bacterium]